MKLQKVKLILFREVLDQLRDRRTLLMILVLPIALYPLLGLGLLQLTLSFGAQRQVVGIVGAKHLPNEPALLNHDGTGFDESLTGIADGTNVILDDSLTRTDISSGEIDALIEVPEGTRDRLADGEQAAFRILYDGADDRSEMARLKVRDILAVWSERVVAWRMESLGYPESYATPLKIDDGVEDISAGTGRSGTAWSRMFPFLLVMMALTGAFYPAIDLCAGEKERGTMETLLISPASRGEIVMGKFLTIFLFSVITTIVNLVSMGLTFAQTPMMMPAGASNVAANLFAPPSLASVFWMLILMLPLSAFFSAICMALAVFARSTKEGQYYLMPLFLIVTPLVFVTLAPGVELKPFYSLVPVTNVALLLKALMLNEYQTAAIYFFPVMIPTILYGYIALRFAADQFHREDVLFREAERFSPVEWLRGQFTNKPVVATVQHAWLFFVLYMLLRWYLQTQFSVTPAGMILQQVFTILVPAVATALLLTTRPMRSLNLNRPVWPLAAVSLLLIICLHPVAIQLAALLDRWMPGPDVKRLTEAFLPLLNQPLWMQFLLIAITPAICEEVAFRGLILRGFLQRHRAPMAILLSSVLFGVSHMVPQQMIATTLLGIVLGIIVTRTGSLLPSIAGHALHNGMAVWAMHMASQNESESVTYPPIIVLAAGLAAVFLLAILIRQPSRLKRVPRAPIEATVLPHALPSMALSESAPVRV